MGPAPRPVQGPVREPGLGQGLLPLIPVPVLVLVSTMQPATATRRSLQAAGVTCCWG